MVASFESFNDELHLKLRSGHHCCQMLHRNTTRRISLGKFRGQNFVARKLVAQLGVREHIFSGEMDLRNQDQQESPGYGL